jgi:hypothetical protein
MRRLALFAFSAVLALPLSAHAQLSVQISMDRDTLMLFESIPVVANVHNFSARTIELAGQGETPWLSFLVSDEAGATIALVAKLPALEPVSVPSGRTASRTINLLPYYDLRQRGTFTVRAIVDNAGMRAVSPPVKFTIMNGREIWKQTAGLPVAAGQTNDEYRAYSLLMLRVGHSDVLYVSVQDEAHGLVYGMIPLGDSLALGEPSAKADAVGHAHVLYRSGPRSYSYAEIDPEGKMVKRAVYSDLLSVPHLVTDGDGLVSVVGGEQTYPRVQRVMTDQELNPPPPPPAKPPKKRWWWPFGPGKPAAATATNAPIARSNS